MLKEKLEKVEELRIHFKVIFEYEKCDDVFLSVEKAVKDGTLKDTNEILNVLDFIKLDMLGDDSFYGRTPELVEVHVSESINAYLIAKYQLKLM